MRYDEVEQLYTRHGPMVIRRCRALLGHEQDALEAAQEVFVKVLERAETLNLAAPSSLLYRIATHHCLNRLRASARRPEVPQADLLIQIAHHHDEAAQHEARSSLARLFRRQEPSTSYMAVLFWVEEMTIEEVAHEVNMSVSGVRKRLRQMRQQLAPTIRELREV